jgi:oxygen-independent coproporphyrinogen-3 oxidase
VGEADMRGLLEGVGPDQALSLYVHIPFCKDICWYCGCNTGRANRRDRLHAYLEALDAEIRTVSSILGGRGRVQRIAFGGGSPNALSALEFIRLVDSLVISFGAKNPDMSVEIDPRSFGKGWALVLGATGARRVSLGVQTFDPVVQAAIGRIQPRDMIADVVARLRANAVSSINFDLMYGLPGQDRAVLESTLQDAIAMRPERIALFGYAHVPHLLPRQKRIKVEHLADQEERFAMAAIGFDRLVAADYVPVGFDHFALPGDPLAQAALSGRLHRNFQGFTDDEAEIMIGLGASAISQGPGLVAQNDKNGGRYRMRAMSGRLATERGVIRTADDRRRGDIIERLLCGEAADIGPFLSGDEMDLHLQPFLDLGLARLRNGMLSVTPDGRPYARTIAALFDGFRGTSQKRFSGAI